MSTFNLKSYLEKTAAKVKPTEALPEKTLRNTPAINPEPQVLTEEQLVKSRSETEPVLTEKKLEKVRTGMTAGDVKLAAAKKVKPTEALPERTLRNTPSINGEPEVITEKQLEGGRNETKETITEAKLEQVRTGSAETLTENLLDSSKSKLVQHRNAEASAGDMSKLEEKRLESKPVEKEKYEAASETDKKREFQEVKGKDGLKTAQFRSRLFPGKEVETIEDLDVDLDEPAELGEEDFPLVIERGRKHEEEEAEGAEPTLEELIDRATRGVEAPSAEELETVEKDIPEGEKEDFGPQFQIGRTIQVDVGGTPVEAVEILFDPYFFKQDQQAVDEAVKWVKHQKEFAGLNEAKIKSSMITDMPNGKITFFLGEKVPEMPKPRRKARK